MIDNIKTIEDVQEFAKQLLLEGANFHPDDDFTSFVNLETGEDTYSSKEAALRNHLMIQSFDVCKACGVDIYDLTMEIHLKSTGLDKYIPIPSSH